MVESKYLIFESPFKPALTTEEFEVLIRSKKHGSILGRIEYSFIWQQFVFLPSPSRYIVLSWECLEDIKNKLKELNESDDLKTGHQK